ncbi:MAG: hypothetical protein Q9M43_11280 [Sulfurimonas sp.]|nr:hypothetical protein [Sulfurimonas sp.]
MVQQKKDFIAALEQSFSKAAKKDEVKLLSFKNYITKSALKYEKDVLLPAFKKMDTLLYGEENE